jgi:peroxiredoxin
MKNVYTAYFKLSLVAPKGTPPTTQSELSRSSAEFAVFCCALHGSNAAMGDAEIVAGQLLPQAFLATQVLGPNGLSRALSTCVGPDVTLIVFVRQFACAGCKARTAELLLHLDALKTAAVRVVVVGCGTAEHARQFLQDHKLDSRPMDLVTDPAGVAHAAAGMGRNRWGTLGVGASVNFVKYVLAGYSNGWGHGDFYQLGGTLLVASDGRVIVVHREPHLGATLPIGEVVEQALVLAARATELGTKLP